MTKLELIVNFFEAHGASTVVIQEDDGNGYTVIEVTLPETKVELTVNE
jgi:hypothetical protein